MLARPAEVVGEEQQAVELVRVGAQQAVQRVGVGTLHAQLELLLRLRVERRVREDEPAEAALAPHQLHAQPRAHGRPRVARPHEDSLCHAPPALVAGGRARAAPRAALLRALRRHDLGQPFLGHGKLA